MHDLKRMEFPASFTLMSEDEMQYTEGGGTVEALIGGAVAVSVSAALLYVGGIAVKGIFGLFSPQTVGAVVDSAKGAVNDLVDSFK